MQMRGKPNQPAFWPNGLPGPDTENGENPVADYRPNKQVMKRYKQKLLSSETNGQSDIKIPWDLRLEIGTGTAAIREAFPGDEALGDNLGLYTKRVLTFRSGWTEHQPRWRVSVDRQNLVDFREDENQLNVLLGAIVTCERKFGESRE
jgi:hypothetical protein